MATGEHLTFDTCRIGPAKVTKFSFELGDLRIQNVGENLRITCGREADYTSAMLTPEGIQSLHEWLRRKAIHDPNLPGRRMT